MKAEKELSLVIIFTCMFLKDQMTKYRVFKNLNVKH